MSNKIALKYNIIPLLLNTLRTGIPVNNSHYKNPKSTPGLIFPSKTDASNSFTVGNINFMGVKKSHTIFVSFRKLGENPDTDGLIVKFIGIKESHTINILFEYKPWPLLDMNTILLLHFGGLVGSKTIVDSSIYNNPVSLLSSSLSRLSNTQRRWGKTSIQLAGRTNGDYADCPYVNFYEGTLVGVEDYTIDFWFYGTIQNADMWDLGHNFFRVAYDRFSLSYANSNYYLDFFVQNTAANRLLFPASTNEYFPHDIRILHVLWEDYITSLLNTWIHIALIRYQDVTKIYINGVALGTSITGFNPSFANYLFITENMIGYLDELRISKCARWTSDFDVPVGPYSDEAVLEFEVVFNLVPSLSISLTAGAVDARSYIKLLAHMDGSENSTTLIDSSIYKHPMAAISETHLTAAGNVLEGTSGFFAGNNYLTVPSSNDWDFSSEDFTIDFWVRLNVEVDITQDNDLRLGFFGRDDSSTNLFYLEFQWNTQMQLVMCVGTVSTVFTYSNLLSHAWWIKDPDRDSYWISNGQFSHVAMVKKSGIIYIYVNGIQLSCPYSNVGTNGYQFTYPTYNVGTLKIGSAGISPSSFLQGNMQNFRVSKGIARWTSEFIPPSSTVGYNAVTGYTYDGYTHTYVMDSYTRLFIVMSGTLNSTTFTNTGLGYYPITNVNNVIILSIINSFGNSSCLFNGTSDYIEIPDSNDWYFDVRDFTIDFRMKLILRSVSGQSIYLSDTQPLFSQGVKGTSDFFGIDYETSPLFVDSTASVPRFIIHIGTTQTVCVFLTAYRASLPTDGLWHHIAIVSYNRKIGFYYDGKRFCNSEIYIDENNTALGYVVFPNISDPFLIGSDGVDFFRGYIDEFRISWKAEWTAAFTPPSVPYTDPVPNIPVGFNEVAAEFSANLFLEVSILKPGERSIEFYASPVLEITSELFFPNIEFDLPIGLNLFHDVIEYHYDFVFSNYWKKEVLDAEYVNTEVDGDYRVALINPIFNFDPDVHEFFIDQVDVYEINSINGYESNLPLVFKDFSSDGLLSFEDFMFPPAKGVYGPVKSLVIYDYAMNAKGQIVGCLTFDTSLMLDNSTIKLSDLSFQIV